MFWSLSKLYHYHDGLVKKTNQKDLIKMVVSKMTCPKWHFGQVEYKGKNIMWAGFFTKFPNQKGHDFS
jgi:hypothetical protein